MAKKNTVFQALDKAITGNWSSPTTSIAEPHINSYDLSKPEDNTVIYRTNDEEDYLQKKLELQQDRYLKGCISREWCCIGHCIRRIKYSQ